MIACRYCTEANLFGWRQAIFTSTCVQCEDRMLAGFGKLSPVDNFAEPKPEPAEQLKEKQ